MIAEKRKLFFSFLFINALVNSVPLVDGALISGLSLGSRPPSTLHCDANMHCCLLLLLSLLLALRLLIATAAEVAVTVIAIDVADMGCSKTSHSMCNIVQHHMQVYAGKSMIYECISKY